MNGMDGDIGGERRGRTRSSGGQLGRDWRQEGLKCVGR